VPIVSTLALLPTFVRQGGKVSVIVAILLVPVPRAPASTILH
jgi:hypothetical protein